MGLVWEGPLTAEEKQRYVNVYCVERVYYEQDRWYERGRVLSSTPYSAEAYAQATAEAGLENTARPLLDAGIIVVRVEDDAGIDYPPDEGQLPKK